MKLKTAQTTHYKSIENSTQVKIEDDTTVIVGVNEAGKSAFLESMYKAAPATKTENDSFNHVTDYPRKDFNTYNRTHADNPDEVISLRYELNDDEVRFVNELVGIELIKELNFGVTTDYANSRHISLEMPEETYVKEMINTSDLNTEQKEAFNSLSTVQELLEELATVEDDETVTALHETLKERFSESLDGWSTLNYNVWKKVLQPRIPQFLYFSDYYTLPGKINLQELQTAIDSGEALEIPLMTAQSLLMMADVSVGELRNPEGYEEIKTKLEGTSNFITDQIFNYWKQNSELEVEFDIRSDSAERAPYNNGDNLYIRIKNKKHRVTVPFDMRSKGFVWFFSFIIWFNSVKEQVGTSRELILLLDEPALSLHALAQKDFLDYIATLSEKHQIIYSTHSPFMIDSEELHRVRTVEDSDNGTIVSSSIGGSNSKTLFPLQSALGYSVAQNLFIAKKNVLVEGPADLIYFKYFGNALETLGKEVLSDDIAIVPVGGLEKVATFVSLLSGNDLEIAVVHDYAGTTDRHLDNLIKNKIVTEKQITNFAQYRDDSNLVPTDVEDMIDRGTYVKLFNEAFAKELNGVKLKVNDLDKTKTRIVQGIEDWLVRENIQLRPTGGFNHYRVADYLASHPIPADKLNAGTVDRFEKIFKTIKKIIK